MGAAVATVATRNPGTASGSQFRSRDEAVTEIIGSILLIALTVIMASILAFMVFRMSQPIDAAHVDSVVMVQAGANGWGNGDEKIIIDHLGGEPLLAKTTTVRYTIGGTPTVLTGAGLGSAFADVTTPDRLVIGERWTRTVTITAGAAVSIDVIVRTPNGASQVLNTQTATVDCSGDQEAPIVGAWIQSPSNVTSNTVGAVTITATVQDVCLGVNGAIVPHLFSRINPGSSPPAFVDRGAMTSLGGNQWRGTIPDPTWIGLGGQSLEYYVSPLTDLGGHTGPSDTRAELIDSLSVLNYVTGNNPVQGSVSSFGNLAADDNSKGTLAEATVTDPLRSYNANALVGAAGTWAGTGNAFASDNAYVTTSSNSASIIQYGHANEASPPAAGIGQVVLKAEVSIFGWNSGSNPDGFQLQACIAAACSTISGSNPNLVGSLATDNTLSYDVSLLRPGGGNWAWADIDNLENRITPFKNGGRDGTWQIDRLWVEATPVTNAMNVEMTISGVPSGATHDLEIEYECTGDTFIVQVWNGATWTTRGSVLNQALPTTWSYTLTAAEYQAGAPKIRFVDQTGTNPVPGQLLLDYVRVRTS